VKNELVKWIAGVEIRQRMKNGRRYEKVARKTDSNLENFMKENPMFDKSLYN
jgi:hypothetical protein